MATLKEVKNLELGIIVLDVRVGYDFAEGVVHHKNNTYANVYVRGQYYPVPWKAIHKHFNGNRILRLPYGS